MTGPVEATWEGDVLCLGLARPPGNILDAEMVQALRHEVRTAKGGRTVRAVVFHGEGKHFSFGASVEEHLPGRVGEMLRGFHALFRELAGLRRPLLAAVTGQCLGGGLELAAFCQRVFARPDAVLGQPEIVLGVFAPVASVVLPRRVGQPAADDLLLSGRTLSGTDAHAIGLVDELGDDPFALATEYAARAFGRHSVSALELAVGAARAAFHQEFLEQLDRLERVYLDELMALKDPTEGLTAFLEKRRPDWSHA